MSSRKKRKKAYQAKAKTTTQSKPKEYVPPKVEKLTGPAARRWVEKALVAEMAAVRSELSTRKENKKRKKIREALSATAGGWKRHPFRLPEQEPTIFEKLWKNFADGVVSTLTLTKWLVQPISMARMQAVERAGTAYEEEYARALACKRLLKKVPAGDGEFVISPPLKQGLKAAEMPNWAKTLLLPKKHKATKIKTLYIINIHLFLSL